MDGTASLAPFDPAALRAVDVYGPQGSKDIVDRLRSQVLVEAQGVDPTTSKGREQLASIAYRVARSKTALDDLGKELVSDAKTRCAVVDAERKRIRDSLDALRDQVRKPVDDWEAIETKRVGDHELALEEVATTAMRGTTLADIDAAGVVVEQLARRDWQEFWEKGDAEVAKSRAILVGRRATLVEAERVRAEATAKADEERATREAHIAEEAAAKATREAEARAELARVAAVEAERIRAATEAAHIDIERLARQADEAHAWAIEGEVVEDLVAAGIDVETAALVLQAIKGGKVRHASVSY